MFTSPDALGLVTSLGTAAGLSEDEKMAMLMAIQKDDDEQDRGQPDEDDPRRR